MTKHFFITVEMGDHSRFTHEPEAVTKNLAFVVRNAVQQMTAGPIPTVSVAGPIPKAELFFPPHAKPKKSGT